MIVTRVIDYLGRCWRLAVLATVIFRSLIFVKGGSICRFLLILSLAVLFVLESAQIMDDLCIGFVII